MVDTARSISDLQTLLADNTSGGISAQKVRDMLVSLKAAYGGMYFTTPAATTPAGASTPLKALGATTAGLLSGFSMPTDNRLRYDGTPTRLVEVSCVGNVVAGVASKKISAHLYHYDASATTGAVIPESEVELQLSGTETDEQVITVLAQVEMDTNDYIELWIENHTDTNTITIDRANIKAIGHIK